VVDRGQNSDVSWFDLGISLMADIRVQIFPWNHLLAALLVVTVRLQDLADGWSGLQIILRTFEGVAVLLSLMVSSQDLADSQSSL
jgi:hypothetical protein